MSKSFLFYWVRDQIKRAIDYGSLLHAASNQFWRCSPGDVIWIAGPGERDALVTIGPICVVSIVGYEEACRALAPLSYIPWEADFHALSDPKNAVIPREVSLNTFLDQLEFVSPKNPRLNVSKPPAQQLQTMRELTPASAKALGALWASKSPERGSVASDSEPSDPGQKPARGGQSFSSDHEWMEGSPIVRAHLRRERAPGLAEAKKADFRRKHGRLFCERCKLDPAKQYRNIKGEACIEVHHASTPIKDMQGEHVTKLDDLQCLCANCHRILHKEMAEAAVV